MKVCLPHVTHAALPFPMDGYRPVTRLYASASVSRYFRPDFGKV
jgi:hypothetical protein